MFVVYPQVVIWDLRRSGMPIKTVSPDGSAVVDIRTSPVGDCLAVSTVKVGILKNCSSKGEKLGMPTNFVVDVREQDARFMQCPCYIKLTP